MTTLAVMQPTFLPWLGYFALIDAADQFIYLDDVQFSKQSWQSRNRIKGPQGPLMLSLRISRQPSSPLILDARLAETDFENKLISTLSNALAKLSHRDMAIAIVENAFAEAEGRLAELNIGIIDKICETTGIKTRRTRSSEMNVPHSEKTDRLIDYCKSVEANVYLSPPGAAGYIGDDAAFSEAGLQLRYFAYDHPEYPQRFGSFVSHMSAIEVLASVGPDQFLELARSGVRTPLRADELTEATK